MSNRSKKPDVVSQEDWDAIESPEISDEIFAKMRPVSIAAPELIDLQKKNLSKRGRPKAESPKKLQSLRLSEDVIGHFKAKGSGWQTRINEALEKIVAREKRAVGKPTKADVSLFKPKSKSTR